MAWKTIIASITIEIGEHTYHASIIRRGDAPRQTYHLMKGTQYSEFDGKGDDNTATVLGMTHMALLLGDELDAYAQPKGPQREQVRHDETH